MNPLLTFGQIAEIVSGKWLTQPKDLQQTLVGGAFDSRDLQEAEIFFTLPGVRDAHEFLPQLAGSRIKLALVTKEVAPLADVALLQVEDSLKALHQLAKHQAQIFKGQIISLTGSSGKTTAKTWLTHLLTPYFKVVSNQGSFNNHIGCPLTILAGKKDTEVLILEMGTNGLGELALLIDIAPADYTLLLNVGHAHLGKFGSLDNTYQAKMEIFSAQRPGGLAIVPAWDEKIAVLSAKLNRVTFGQGQGDYQYELLDYSPDGQRVAIQTPLGKRSFFLTSPGAHAPSSVTALMPIFCGLGVFDQLPEQLELPTAKGRGLIFNAPGGALLVDDTYNANPESVINLISTLTQLPGENYIAVIGNLGELEEDLAQSANLIVEHIPERLDHLFLTGATGLILAPLIQKAHPLLDVRYYPAFANLLTDLKTYDQPGNVIGVKGSRSAHMERVILLLKGSTLSCLLPSCPLLANCATCEKNHGYVDALGD